MKIHVFFCVLFTIISLVSCSRSKNQEENNDGYSTSNQFYSSSDNSCDVSNNSYDYNDEETYNQGFNDGTYTASVDYTNYNTGFSNSYVLDVDVVDNMVVQINFPNGGYLDDSHFDPIELDDNGYCAIETYDGLLYEVTIDN